MDFFEFFDAYPDVDSAVAGMVAAAVSGVWSFFVEVSDRDFVVVWKRGTQ